MFWNNSGHILVEFSEDYAKIHGRIVYPLTIVGILTSLVTIIILNRKSFSSPTNLILSHVAYFDTIVLITYNIYSFYFYILHDPNPFVGQHKFWPRFAIYHSNIGLTAHSIALWLTCLLAIIRYRIIRSAKQVVVKSRDVILLIWMVIVLICLLMIPNCLVWSVVYVPAHVLLPKSYSINSTESVYWISSATGEGLEKISFVIISICFKICPVIILIIFSILLIINIRHARQFRSNLLSRCSSMNSQLNLNREMRTTRMLILITLCTGFVELPQGILLIAIGIDKELFLFYSHLGDFWDLTSISSSFITFIMYCSMSQQFRMEILELVLPKFVINKWNLKSNSNCLRTQNNLKQMKRENCSLINRRRKDIHQNV